MVYAAAVSLYKFLHFLRHVELENGISIILIEKVHLMLEDLVVFLIKVVRFVRLDTPFILSCFDGEILRITMDSSKIIFGDFNVLARCFLLRTDPLKLWNMSKPI